MNIKQKQGMWKMLAPEKPVGVKAHVKSKKRLTEIVEDWVNEIMPPRFRS